MSVVSSVDTDSVYHIHIQLSYQRSRYFSILIGLHLLNWDYFSIYTIYIYMEKRVASDLVTFVSDSLFFKITYSLYNYLYINNYVM